MNDSQPQPAANEPKPTPSVWTRPTLTALPPLRDLTLQSGIAGAGSSLSGVTFR